VSLSCGKRKKEKKRGPITFRWESGRERKRGRDFNSPKKKKKKKGKILTHAKNRSGEGRERKKFFNFKKKKKQIHIEKKKGGFPEEGNPTGEREGRTCEKGKGDRPASLMTAGGGWGKKKTSQMKKKKGTSESLYAYPDIEEQEKKKEGKKTIYIAWIGREGGSYLPFRTLERYKQRKGGGDRKKKGCFFTTEGGRKGKNTSHL